MTERLVELTKLRMAISRVTSTQSETTNTRSAALVETPRDSPDIHWTLSGILERHFWQQIHIQRGTSSQYRSTPLSVIRNIHQVCIYLQVSSESDGQKQHQYREGYTVRHGHLKIPAEGRNTDDVNCISLTKTEQLISKASIYKNQRAD